MISILDILSADDINFALAAKEKSAAIQEVLFLLCGDLQVVDFEALCTAVQNCPTPVLSLHGKGICIAHGRTNAVSGLVLAVGRSDSGILSPEIPDPIHLLFVAGIPTAFDNEYLRIVGALVRACSNVDILNSLLRTQDHNEFIHELSSVETPF